jgi:hypothetical protein
MNKKTEQPQNLAESLAGAGNHAYEEKDRQLRDREREIWRSNLHRSTPADYGVSELKALPNGVRVAGNPGGWEQLASRAFNAQKVREPTGDYGDPDSVEAENRRLGDAQVVATTDPRSGIGGRGI